jgi:peptidoglycan hydrolase CwlO-like protein
MDHVTDSRALAKRPQTMIVSPPLGSGNSVSTHGKEAMKRKMIIALSLIGVIALAACSDDTLGDVPTTLPDIPSTLPESEDVLALVADIQTEMDVIASEIENSEATDDLQDAWNEIEAEAQAVIASATQEGDFDTAGLEQELQEFQDTLTAMGDDVSDELMSSWNELRQAFDQLIN